MSMSRGGTRGTTGGNTPDRNSGFSSRNSKFEGMQNSLNAGGGDRPAQTDAKKSNSKESQKSENSKSSSKKSNSGPVGPAKL